jgi:hypothetical protein
MTWETLPLRAPTATAIWTTHARQRAADRGISEADVEATVASPGVIYPDPDYPDRRRLRRGDVLVVVAAHDPRVVITVRWRDPA